MLLGTLRANLLSNLLSGKRLARAGVKKTPKIQFDVISSINKY